MKLTIITINYNDSTGLHKTIQSVINQTFNDYEYIIIDGGSTDGSKEIIEKYSHKLTYWVSEKDTGIYNAMNKGIKQAKGEYCLFLNSGDWLINKNIIEEVVGNFSDKDIVYGDMQTPKGVWKNPDKLNFSILLFSGIGHPVTFIRTSLFKKYGYYSENYKILSDWEFMMIALKKNTCSYKHINKVISYFNLDGISSDIKKSNIKEIESKDILKKIFPVLVYDDYIELLQMRGEIEFYKNSKLIQAIKSIQQSKLYKKIRGVA